MAEQTRGNSTQLGAAVWVKGPGLNSLTLPTRAQRFLGSEWETGRVRARILRESRLGQVLVRLHTGDEVLVSSEWIEVVDVDPADAQDNRVRDDADEDCGRGGGPR